MKYDQINKFMKQNRSITIRDCAEAITDTESAIGVEKLDQVVGKVPER